MSSDTIDHLVAAYQDLETAHMGHKGLDVERALPGAPAKSVVASEGDELMRTLEVSLADAMQELEARSSRRARMDVSRDNSAHEGLRRHEQHQGAAAGAAA